ncbi:hypothetical protein BP5796_00949 [Coleophoma crateriformis]|uniref:Uncharacterized protein n=1 Tax=Coleophoma crateriformis TaxID=565419 RepID=A0A3D8T9G6_9HELO|nr:hypothetical protein BP5796_00949 [Coleophoma crateriformis]
MACRTFGRVLRSKDYGIIAIPCPQTLAQRSFSSSASLFKHGAIPTFTTASSPELDQILSEIRKAIFLPSHLSKDYQKLIYSKQGKNRLEKDPVYVDINGERFRLDHVDRTRDVPNHTATLFEAIDLMEKGKDFDNIAIILEGYQDAGYVMNEGRKLGLMKHLSQKGRLDVVLELARRGKNTAFHFTEQRVLEKWIFELQLHAANSNWDKKHTQQALSWLEMTADMLQNSTHKVPSTSKLYSVLLQLAAVRATRHLGGSDDGGKVADYAEKLYATSWDTALPAKARPEDEKNMRLKSLVTILHGSKLAVEVLDPASTITKQLQDKMPELQAEVANLKESLEQATQVTKTAWGGIQLYNKSFGPNSL